MGKIVSFSNQKGGVGKTTTCVNMAAYIASFGKKVLLVDIDPQGNATTGFGLSKSSLKESVYNVLIEDEEKASANIRKTEMENLDLLPSNIDLAGAEVELVYNSPTNPPATSTACGACCCRPVLLQCLFDRFGSVFP